MESASALFFDAFQASPVGIALENLEGQPLFVNPALCSMLGFSEEEMCGKHCTEFSPPEDAQQDRALFEKLRYGLIDNYTMDKRFFKRDGSMIWGRLSVSLSNHRPRPMVVAMVQDITEKKAANEERLRAQQNLSQKLIEAQEQERSRIARELHDNINQQVGLLAVRLDVLRNNLFVPPEMAGELYEAVRKLEELGKEVQALSHRLHSPKLQYLGLSSAASSLCKDVAILSNVNIQFVSENVPKELPAETALCMFRVLQESLQNAIKHSGSNDFEVSLMGRTEEILLTVRDSGVGFDAEVALRRGGIGLLGMQERLKLVNGTLSIESEPHSGTTIRAGVPFKTEAQPAGIAAA